MNYIKILYCVIISLLSISLNAQDSTKTIVEGYGTQRLYIGQNKKAVIEIYGKSEKCIGHKGVVKWNEDVGIIKDTRRSIKKRWKNLFCYESGDLYVHFKKNKIISIGFKTNKYRTTKGATIGDSREKITTLYGGGHDSPRIVYYSLGIAFQFNGDKVVAIEVFCPQTR